MKLFKWLIFVIAITAVAALVFAPTIIDKQLNPVERSATVTHIPNVHQEVHNRLVIMDWHADSTLWNRELLERHDYGQVDVPRLQEGNVAIQMFTTVTKAPAGLNYQQNSADATDQITQLALVSAWPVRTWNNLTERALYQAQKVKDAVKASANLRLILNQSDLSELLSLRATGQRVVGAMIGTEGSHALEGSTLRIQDLYDAGFRMMSLQHFFDNRLGGSLHGESNGGLTDFGKSAVQEMERLRIIVDVSHSSEAVVRDVLEIATRPLVVSHTGVYGHCPKQRNISDELMLRIAEKGGLIAIGYWDGAVCATGVEDVVNAMRYAIDLLGEDHVALGSDFDGTVKTPFDTSELNILTHTMLEKGFTIKEINKVMGSNSINFLKNHLPPAG
ncbi:MAG: dipeptidase [Enterobacterales bacterium]|nr:dipeptidase [Enterobacterales bacterium]